MKKFVLLFIAYLLVQYFYAQTTIWTENFNNNSQYTLTLGGEGNNGIADYFQRTDGLNINKTYTGKTGTYFFAGQDIDDGGWTGSASPSQLTWSAINISSYTSVSFKADFASTATNKIDNPDYVHFEYKLDGGSWINLIWFENNGTTNTYLIEDTDFDGVGDGTQLNSALTTFTKSIPDGNSLELRMTVALNSADEDFAVDNIIISGNPASSVADPTNLSAKAISSTQINISWTQNANSDNVMLAWSADGTFGTPVDGNAYVAGNTITGGGTVLYNGGLTAYGHSGLTAATQYYYKAWSVDGSNIYSTGITANATTPVHTSLIISEIADPTDVYQARFVEIYNLGASTIDFTTDTWYLCRQTNGGTWEDKQLTGSVLASGEYVSANGNTDASDYFNINYGFMADFDFGGSSGNGDDGYFLYYNGDHTNGTLIDAYGVINQDGTGAEWEYTDSKAVRLRSVSSPNTIWTSSEWSIVSSANVDDMTPSAHNEDVNWVGNIADWNTKGSDCWTGTHNFIPDASFNVTIPSGLSFNPSTSSYSECNNLIINSSASATVSYNAPLTVFGDLNVNPSNASLNIASGTSGNGSVIIKGSISGSANVSRYFKAYTGASDGWHYISSPVNSMTIASSDFDPSGTNNDLYAWDEDDYLWRNYKGSYFPSLDFVNGTGYMVAYQNNTSNHFIGTLNNTDISYSNLTKTLAKGDGWHLLGNPFPSAIYWGTADWALTNIGGVAKVYNEAAGTYTDISSNDIIPSTNGFFVQASVDASNNITIPASARVHDNSNNYKYPASSDLDETLNLLVNNNGNDFYDVTTVGFRNDALSSFDWTFDSHKMFGQQTAPQIWTLSGGEQYSTNFLPFVYEELDLPLNFKAGINTTYHIVAQGIENFYQNSEIYLEDLQSSNIINLREQQIYTFEGKTSDDNARFILHFFGITDVDNASTDNQILIYKKDNDIFVKSPENLNYKMTVFDIMGREVYSGLFISDGLNMFKVNLKHGIYIIKLQQGNSVNTTKTTL
jgi:hypothetical protein